MAGRLYSSKATEATIKRSGAPFGLCFARQVQESNSLPCTAFSPKTPTKNPEKGSFYYQPKHPPHDLPQEALEEVIEKLQELTGTARASADGGSAGEHSSNLMGDEDLGFPTLEPVPGHLAIVKD